MKIEHIALYVNDLEASRNFFVKYFGATSNDGYCNPKTNFRSYFLSFEGFWWQDDTDSVDFTDKAAFNWISVIRLPDFVTKEDFAWAVEAATKKKS